MGNQQNKPANSDQNKANCTTKFTKKEVEDLRKKKDVKSNEIVRK